MLIRSASSVYAIGCIIRRMRLIRLRHPTYIALGIVALFVCTFVGPHHVTGRGQKETPPLVMVNAAHVPLYPPTAIVTNTQGIIHVRATTDGNRVVAAHAEEHLRPLSDAAEENALTWRFVEHRPYP
jgi:hypothetical protein